MKTSSIPGNRNSEKSMHFVPQRKIGAIVHENSPPPITQSQIDLIAKLRKYLDDAGVRNDFIIVPEDGRVASHVIRALIRLAKAHNVDTGRGNRSLNGV